MKERKKYRSKREEELFQCLLLQYNLKQLTARFPTVREIRSLFRCGQPAATAALNRLAEYYHFKRVPRSKSRLTLDLSQSDGRIIWDTWQYQRRECSIMFSQDVAFCWQPIVDEYNKIHPSTPIRTHLVCYMEEFRTLENDSPVDLVLLPNHPKLCGLNQGLSIFKDLTQLAKKIPKQHYYDSTFLHDRNGQLRAIAPALVPKLWVVNGDLTPVPEKDLTVRELPGLLSKIKKENPSLRYAAAFDSYLGFFSCCGLDPARSMIEGFKDRKQWENALELFRKLYRKNLVPSVCDLINSGYPFFADRQLAILELYYSKIPRFQEKRTFDFILPPRNGNTQHNIISELLGICHGSIRYEQAWDFIVFTLQPPIQQLLLSRMNAFSVLKGLKPCRMEESLYRRISPVLGSAVRRESDHVMTPALFRCFESSVDSLIKYGGSIQLFQEDFLNQYKNTLSGSPIV
jgi:hypothetical protein